MRAPQVNDTPERSEPGQRLDGHGVRADGFYAVYSDYSRVLRTWLVAYGVGGPVLFLTQDEVAQRIADSGNGRWIAIMFLSGAAAQIAIAALNKWVNWVLYSYYQDGEETTVTRAAHTVSRQFWLDMLADGGSIALFGWATWEVLVLFTG